MNAKKGEKGQANKKPVAPVMEAPSSALKVENVIQKNIRLAFLTPMKKQPDANESPYMFRKDYGKVPAYLKKMQQEKVEGKEEAEAPVQKSATPRPVKEVQKSKDLDKTPAHHLMKRQNASEGNPNAVKKYSTTNNVNGSSRLNESLPSGKSVEDYGKMADSVRESRQEQNEEMLGERPTTSISATDADNSLVPGEYRWTETSEVNVVKVYLSSWRYFRFGNDK